MNKKSNLHYDTERSSKMNVLFNSAKHHGLRFIALAGAALGVTTALGGVASSSGADVTTSSVTNGNTVTITSVYKFSDTTAPGSIVFNSATTADILVVGGGGGGGYGNGSGGGGGGGVVYREDFAVAAGTYAITVGAGGAGGNSTTPVAGNGGNSRSISSPNLPSTSRTSSPSRTGGL